MLVPVIVRRAMGGLYVIVRPVSEALSARIVADMVRNGAVDPDANVLIAADDVTSVFPRHTPDSTFGLFDCDLWTLRQLYGYSDSESERRFR